jgi:ribonuclease D
MAVKKTSEPIWISSTNNLTTIVDKLVKHKKIAIDTESNSLHAFQEQVCLIQISIPGSDYLIDPLEIKDISPLKPVFFNEEIEKIFHAAEYDLLCLKRDFDFSVNNIFDTMQAARILGYRAVGLNHLLLEKYNISVDKRYQKADWAKRPLPPAQLNYARMDTHYLIDLRDELHAELNKRNLWELAKEEFQRISICGENHSEPPMPAWQRINGASKLNPHQVPVLKALLEWRITQAERMNRPVFKIVSNKLLMNLSQSAPKRISDLPSAGLSNRQIQMFGDSIIAAVKKGLQAEPIKLPKQPKPDQAFLQRLDNLRDWRKKTGIKLGFESDVILPRSFMEIIAKQNPKDMKALTKLMPDSPWRLNHYGEEILHSLKD